MNQPKSLSSVAHRHHGMKSILVTYNVTHVTKTGVAGPDNDDAKNTFGENSNRIRQLSKHIKVYGLNENLMQHLISADFRQIEETYLQKMQCTDRLILKYGFRFPCSAFRASNHVNISRMTN